MLNFLNPWGLLALASLGGVLFLYFYVFRGVRREVSALFLWDPDRSLRREGRKRRRPPLDLPLLLELLAALLLSLVVAGLAYERTEQRGHLVLILDSSASMNASRGDVDYSDRARRAVSRLADAAGDGVGISLVESFRGRVLGGGAVSAERAAELLRQWQPADPPHAFEQAVEVARSLQSDPRPVPLITDHRREGVGFRAIGVGHPLPNTGWVGGRWAGENEIFARLRHLGGDVSGTEITVRDGRGREISRKKVDFSDRSSVPLTLTVPGQVRSVRLELPDDALANDNVLRLTRPLRHPLSVQIQVENEELARRLENALAAVGGTRLIERGSPALLFTDAHEMEEAAAGVELRVRFHLPPPQVAQTYGGPYFVDAHSPLTRGLDLKGTLWGADPGFAAGDAGPLVSVGDIPLVVIGEHGMAVNFSPDRTNLFGVPAWPVLVSNAVDLARARRPGIKRFSYRLGENLSFVRPHRWDGGVIVEDPAGETVSFDGPRIYYGAFRKEGFYRIYPTGQPESAVTVAVNLLAEQESDLTGAESFGEQMVAQPGRLEETGPWTFHRLFALAAVAAMLGCWYALERRR